MFFTLFLTGCSVSSEAEENILIVSDSGAINMYHDHANNLRQARIISRVPTGIFDERSLFAFPIFIPTEELRPIEERLRVHSRLANIYRTIYPWNREDDAFEILYQNMNEASKLQYANDILTSFLLTEDSIAISDKELLERLSYITNSYVFSEYTNSMNFRLIGVNHNTERVFIWYNETWSYFMQVWNDDYIWAQPLIEGTEIIFNDAVFVTSQCENMLVILAGYTRTPPGNGLALASAGFLFENDIWAPVTWLDVFEEVVQIEGTRIASDGVLTGVRYPSWWGVPNETEPFFLKLLDDGSIWADYSMGGNSANEELLFRPRLMAGF